MPRVRCRPWATVYGSSTISGSANVQFSNVTNHHSTIVGKDTIHYTDPLSILHGLFFHISCIDSRPGAHFWPKFAIGSKLRTLSLDIARLQHTQQKDVRGPIHQHDRKCRLGSITAEGQVAYHQAMAKDLQVKSAERARAQCSNQEGMSCVDVYCDPLTC